VDFEFVTTCCGSLSPFQYLPSFSPSTVFSSLTSLGLFVSFHFHQFSVFRPTVRRPSIMAHNAIYTQPSVALHYLPHHVFPVPPFLPPYSLVFPSSLFHVIFHRSLQPVTSHALPYRLSPVLTPHPHSTPFLSAIYSLTAPSPLAVLFSLPFFSSRAILN